MSKTQSIRNFRVPHARVLTPVGDTSMTKQSHKDECNINFILKQYQRTGIITHISNNSPQYIDLPSDIDYQSSMNTLIQAQEAFASLPAVVRDFFANDPEKFLGAFQNEKMRPQLEEWGLLKPRRPGPDPQAAPAPPVPKQAEP